MRAIVQSAPRNARPSRMVTVGGLLMLLLVSCMTAERAGAQSSLGRESRLKAAYLYKFTLFVEWPAAAFAGGDDPLVIAIVGRDPFDGNLELLLEGKRVHDHPFKVVPVRTGELERTRPHLLFVARSEGQRAGSLFEQVRMLPILTVSDMPEFAHRGGMIEVFEEDGTLRFEINRAPVDQAGLKISSQLLSLARITVTSLWTSKPSF
jgi:hypothetical protein